MLLFESCSAYLTRKKARSVQLVKRHGIPAIGCYYNWPKSFCYGLNNGHCLQKVLLVTSLPWLAARIAWSYKLVQHHMQSIIPHQRLDCTDFIGVKDLQLMVLLCFNLASGDRKYFYILFKLRFPLLEMDILAVRSFLKNHELMNSVTVKN